MRRWARWPSILTAALFVACGGAEIRGGHGAQDRALSRTTRLFSFVPNDCRDAHESPTTGRSARVDIVRMPSGAAALVELRPGYDALVVENSFLDGKVQVFQAIIQAEDHEPLLHEFRIPELATGIGEVTVSDRFDEESFSSGAFRARGMSLVSRCVLSPLVEAAPAEVAPALPEAPPKTSE